MTADKLDTMGPGAQPALALRTRDLWPVGLVLLLLGAFVGVIGGRPVRELAGLGEAFGVINAAFSGLAFAGLIITILLQSRRLCLQRARWSCNEPRWHHSESNSKDSRTHRASKTMRCLFPLSRVKRSLRNASHRPDRPPNSAKLLATSESTTKGQEEEAADGWIGLARPHAERRRGIIRRVQDDVENGNRPMQDGMNPVRRCLLAILLLPTATVVIAASSGPARTKQSVPSNQSLPQAADTKIEPDKRGTNESPAIIELRAAPPLRVESVDKTDRPIDRLSSEWLSTYATIALALITGGLALYTGKLYRATVQLGAEAKAAGQAQATRMERSILEAARAATAMEQVATATSNNAQLMSTLFRKQMRAYVSVEIGAAAYQDARLRFEGKPSLVNNGLTPARNVSHAIRAQIIDGRDRTHVVFPELPPIIVSDVGLAPRQSVVLSAIVYDRLPDDQVDHVMSGNDRRLFVWGKVTYDDVYGDSWETHFRVNYHFPRDAQGNVGVQGAYYWTGNSAT
jgi:hypothetical protein